MKEKTIDEQIQEKENSIAKLKEQGQKEKQLKKLIDEEKQLLNKPVEKTDPVMELEGVDLTEPEPEPKTSASADEMVDVKKGTEQSQELKRFNAMNPD